MVKSTSTSLDTSEGTTPGSSTTGNGEKCTFCTKITLEVARALRQGEINLNPVGITDHEDELEEEGDEDSASLHLFRLKAFSFTVCFKIDLNDIVHDDLIADLLIRVLNSPLIDDPLWISNESNKNTEAPAFMKFDISYDEITQLCEKASASFLAQPALVKIEKAELPVHIVADLHGNLPQVLRVFKFCGIPQKETFLFLGDYVDRGVQGIEVITLLFCLKIRYPFQVYLLRGNHEDANTTLNYGFFDECITRWPSTEANAPGVKAFNCMPVAAIIADTIYCAHGGISPFIDKLSDINKIKRPSVVPAYGIGCDLVWSDPALHRDGWVLSHRGISFLFGPKAVEDFCAKHHLDIILRGHQISNEAEIDVMRDLGWSVRRMSQRIDRSRDCIARYLRNPLAYNTKTLTGRPKKLSERDRRSILRLASNSTKTASEIRERIGAPSEQRHGHTCTKMGIEFHSTDVLSPYLVRRII
ncbi:Ser/Thr phosphatase family protein [Ostertagia ostertagi]